MRTPMALLLLVVVVSVATESRSALRVKIDSALRDCDVSGEKCAFSLTDVTDELIAAAEELTEKEKVMAKILVRKTRTPIIKDLSDSWGTWWAGAQVPPDPSPAGTDEAGSDSWGPLINDTAHMVVEAAGAAAEAAATAAGAAARRAAEACKDSYRAIADAATASASW